MLTRCTRASRAARPTNGLNREGSRSTATAGMRAISRGDAPGVSGVDPLAGDLVPVTPLMDVAAQRLQGRCRRR